MLLNIVVRVSTVDRDGFIGREHHPSPEMEGQCVRITAMDTLSSEELGTDEPIQVFDGILLDANGDDVPGGEVELVSHEIEAFANVPRLFHV